MMHVNPAGLLRREFADRSEAAIFRRFQQQQREELKRRERDADLDQDTTEILQFAVAIVTVSETSAFRQELDHYDAATIIALKENDRLLSQAVDRQEALLLTAHVLPDGRRVVKTEDGRQVFDEHGAALDLAVIEPDAIADHHPTWETYKPVLNEVGRLRATRQELFDYQARLDDARQRLDSGSLTRDEFEQLRDELKADMPEAVRAQMPELDGVPEPETGAQPANADIELAITDDMVPTGPAAKPFIPG